MIDVKQMDENEEVFRIVYPSEDWTKTSNYGIGSKMMD